MRRTDLPRFETDACSAIGVPWMARERRRGVPLRRVLTRLALASLLTTAFSACAAGQDVAAPSADHPSVTPPATQAVASEAPTSAPPSAPERPAHALAATVTPPADLRDPQAWVDYKTARHLASLPQEARLLHRHGILAMRSGQRDQAVGLVRAAATLDPAFLDPHLTLASWAMGRDPSQSLLHYAAALELLRRDFGLQLDLAANATILLLQALFVGLLAAALCVVWLRRAELVHGWQEWLARFAHPASAPFWAPAMLTLPFLAGFGLTLPALMSLAYLGPQLRVRERILFGSLLAAVLATPFALRTLERFALPMHENAAPFHGVAALENATPDPERIARLRALAAKEPDNPFVQFALGWTARRSGDLATAESAYRRTLQIWPDDARVMTDLGNVLAMQGRTDDALDTFARAATTGEGSAAAWFNASQLHTQRLDYARANDALQHASALDFDLVKHHQAQTTQDGLLVLADQWLAPERFWQALWKAPLDPGAQGSLPAGMRGPIETTGWPFSLAAVLLTVGSFLLGRLQNRRLPLRACGSCGRVTCRRCATRRRENALCPECSRIEQQAETPDFSRVLLLQHRSRLHRRSHLVRTALATLIPGYGLLACRRIITPVILMSATWLVVCLWTGTSAPFAAEARLWMPGHEVPTLLLAAVMAVIELWSLLAYFHLVGQERAREAQLAAAQRGRFTQASHRLSAAA